MAISISKTFDAGNIEVLSAERPDDIQLLICPDNQSDFFQWFYFRAVGVCDTPVKIAIINAHESSFPEAWEGYEAVASYDCDYWFRVPTRYENGQLIIEHTPELDSIYYAYFTPYSLDRHQQLLAMSQCDEHCRLSVAGTTVQGRDIDVLQVGSADAKHRVWVTARQHPGESMAEWLIEGLLERLLDSDDAVSEVLLDNLVFYIVPNMNPDGSTLGNLRTNAAGVNLNRVWGIADPETSPEVFYIQRMMEQTGCDLFLDIHGDEEIPYNFIAGQLGSPAAESILEQEAIFQQRLADTNPDFQTKYGYATDRFGPEMLTLASYWAGNHFGIPAMTLEMPFKDNQSRPDAEQGWSAERSKLLGASLLGPIKAHFAV